jgi:cell division protein FtsN
VSQEEKKGRGGKKATLTAGKAKLLGYGLAVTFLMVWVFILGVLTGRGDVNYLFQRLGLYKTNWAARLGIAPSNQVSAALPVAHPTEDPKALPDSGKKPGPASEVAEITPAAVVPTTKATDQVASKTQAETSQKPGFGNHEAKKTKGSNQPKHDQGHSLASKLSFQNSLDTPTRKQSKSVAQKEATVHTASIATPPSNTAAETTAGEEKKKAACAYQVRVASYRTTEEAEKTMADLKKKGFNVKLQKGKDKSGAIYIIKTGRYTNKAEAEKVTKKLKEPRMNGQIQEVNQ